MLYTGTKLCFTDLKESISTVNIYEHGDENTHQQPQLFLNEHMD
jgi:hypothetical protein